MFKLGIFQTLIIICLILLIINDIELIKGIIQKTKKILTKFFK